LRNLAMAPAVPDLDGFRARFGVRVCTAYAMTEIPVPFTSEGWDVTNWKASGKLKGGYPGLEVRVVDEHDYEVGPGEVGELILRASEPWTVTPGYYGMPEATAAAWRNGWFHTGDGFTYDADGYYYFVDRLKDTIRRRGENISSFEVEGMVNQHPGVAETAAVAAPSDVTEDEILVYVIPKPGHELDPAELVLFLAPRAPRFMIPRYVMVVDDLPRTQGSMRVQKAILRQAGLPEGVWDREAAGVVIPR
jgi:crotonobetaine/carnitine-CoA ligase